MRVVVGVHYRTTNSGTEAHVALTTGLTDLHICMIGIANHANGSHAVAGHVAQLAGGQTNHALAVLLSHQLSADACGTNQLCALARVQLDVVDHGTNRDVLNRQAVARLDVGILGGDDLVADLQTLGSEDVCLLAVLILDESDVGRTVRVVLDGLDFCENVELLTLEVNDTVLLLVAAADVANGDAAFLTFSRRLFSGFTLDRP